MKQERTKELFKVTSIQMSYGATAYRAAGQLFHKLRCHTQGDWGELANPEVISRNNEALAQGGVVQSYWPLCHPDCGLVIATRLPDGATELLLDIEVLIRQKAQDQEKSSTCEPTQAANFDCDQSEHSRLGELRVTQEVLSRYSYQEIASWIDQHARGDRGGFPPHLVEHWAAVQGRISMWPSDRRGKDEIDPEVVFTLRQQTLVCTSDQCREIILPVLSLLP